MWYAIGCLFEALVTGLVTFQLRLGSMEVFFVTTRQARWREVSQRDSEVTNFSDFHLKYREKATYATLLQNVKLSLHLCYTQSKTQYNGRK
jgi:hypothetical protein